MKTLQKFASVHADVHNHSPLRRLIDRQTYKNDAPPRWWSGKSSRARLPPSKTNLDCVESGSR